MANPNEKTGEICSPPSKPESRNPPGPETLGTSSCWPLHLRTGESGALRCTWFLAAGLGGTLAALGSAAGVLVKVSWVMLSWLAAGWALRRLPCVSGLLVLRCSGMGVWRADDGTCVDGAVQRECWVSPWLAVLSLEPWQNTRRLRVVVQRSRQGPGEFRRLVVWLRQRPDDTVS